MSLVPLNGSGSTLNWFPWWNWFFCDGYRLERVPLDRFLTGLNSGSKILTLRQFCTVHIINVCTKCYRILVSLVFVQSPYNIRFLYKDLRQISARMGSVSLKK